MSSVNYNKNDTLFLPKINRINSIENLKLLGAARKKQISNSVMNFKLFARGVIFDEFLIICWRFQKINLFLFKKLFQEHYQSVKWFGSRAGTTFWWSWFVSKLFSKVIRSWQKSLLARKV